MDQQYRVATPVAHRQLGAVSLSWALGALASLLLAFWHLPYALFASALSSGPSLALGFPAILFVQAGLCLVCAAGWLHGRLRLVAVAVAVLTATHAGVASIAWPDYSPILWTLWIGPVLMIIPALINLAAAATRKTHSP